MIPKLGAVEFLPLREVWKNEATSFTPWLLENENVLGDLLGIEISLTMNEEKVGAFSLDLLGVNLTDDSTLIVENQLERTDHSHLGQLLTYAGGLDPSTIVWIASEFRDEHRAALDWLNEVTDDTTHFFGVVVKAIKIGDSLPAPWLELVVQPNSWSELTRRAKNSSEISETQQRYGLFWQQFLDRYAAHNPIYKGKHAPQRQWLSLGTGVPGILIGLNVLKGSLKVDLYFGHNDPDVNQARLSFLEQHRGEVESAFGSELSWESLEDRKGCRVGYYGEGGVDDESAWAQSQAWLHEAATRFAAVTQLPAFQELRTIS
jgi:hypothetical protein